jgi:hypothetical protein
VTGIHAVEEDDLVRNTAEAGMRDEIGLCNFVEVLEEDLKAAIWRCTRRSSITLYSSLREGLAMLRT